MLQDQFLIWHPGSQVYLGGFVLASTGHHADTSQVFLKTSNLTHDPVWTPAGGKKTHSPVSAVWKNTEAPPGGSRGAPRPDRNPSNLCLIIETLQLVPFDTSGFYFELAPVVWAPHRISKSLRPLSTATLWKNFIGPVPAAFTFRSLPGAHDCRLLINRELRHASQLFLHHDSPAQRLHHNSYTWTRTATNQWDADLVVKDAGVNFWYIHAWSYSPIKIGDLCQKPDNKVVYSCRFT